MMTINNPKTLKILKYVLAGLVSLIILSIVLGALLFLFYISTAPKLSENSLKSTNSSLIYDANNKLIADLGSEKRESVTADSIPLNLVNAITAIEDKRFFKHRGVDLYRIMGAAWHNLTSSGTQGGSTLDQQLIKLAYFSTKESDQTLKRKAQEVWLALQMERRYTKEEILTFYINKVYMGNGNYGMLTAAKAYYGKDLKDLSYAQLALLAGIPQAPTQYDPYNQPESAANRRNVVLQQMFADGDISKAQYDKAINTPVTDGLQPLKASASYPKYLDNYLKEVIKDVRMQTNKDIFTSGLKVYTNIQPDVQQRLFDIYNSHDYVAYPDKDFQVASTIIDVTNGHVIAQLGGRHQDTKVSFGTNQAVLTDRDWGSTMKPITDYAPAIESGVYTSTAQSTNDSVYYWPDTNIQLYNWDRRYNGLMTIQTAIMLSRNVPAVKALEATGLGYAKSFLSDLGINYPELHYSNAISSNTSSSDQKYGASSEKMAAAYAAFSNGGLYYKPQYVNKIEFNDGTTKSFDTKGKRVMKETTAYMMTDMLKTVLTYGTGIEAQIPGVIQAGKTGTSNYTDDELTKIGNNFGLYVDYVGTMAPDENFVGYTNKYAMAVWTGYRNRLMPVYGDGLKIASLVYRNMMSYLTDGYSEDWIMPSGLYRSGNYLYLNGGTYTTNNTNSSSVYNNIYNNSSTAASNSSNTHAKEAEDSTNSSKDDSNASNGTNSGNGSNPPVPGGNTNTSQNGTTNQNGH
ncbi:penicillin-binding protein PBP1A [Streptococcus halichoeri]|uniref:penicillin-binding protein PBP1A n=1 Tax=Streptococcus halichoeri TaxID=254785 RepID=UPI00135CAEF8